MPYTKKFYVTRHAETLYTAQRVCSILTEKMPVISSVVDVGCGVGTWLSVLREIGVQDIQGIDGKWVDKKMLVIPEENFLEMDLMNLCKITKRFDLAICLEVAEHLPAGHADMFIRWLTELSDFVLFSAAIPFQSGGNHMNEAWQSYWVKLFVRNDYQVYDFIRPSIWNDVRIPFWYRQNILFFARTRLCEKLNLRKDDQLPIDIVHPELFLSKCRQLESSTFLRRLIHTAGKALKFRFKKKHRGQPK